MTEEKKKDLAYLQGQVEMLEFTLNNIVALLPDRAMWLIRHEAKIYAKLVETERDADAQHMRWMRAQQQTNPTTVAPFVTKYSAGQLAVLEPLSEMIEETIGDRVSGDSLRLIQPFPGTEEIPRTDEDV